MRRIGHLTGAIAKMSSVLLFLIEGVSGPTMML